MSFLECCANSIGSITILTEDRCVFQGQVVKNRDQERARDQDYICIELTCDVSVICGNRVELLVPAIYRDGDLVRINICNIVAVGPSNGCPTNCNKPKEPHCNHCDL
ncbi:hypothetical protein [Anaerosinus massiliensis]|uniref:hypothetical protein n=1 Tax=Massilibacillus massiliensis TaxID=1806837 RepID=UPI000DA5F66A|nr:hypothetical protein [Massilibacillus massiliensis]